MEDEDFKIEEDRKNHPGCSYSQSFRKMCSNKNGEGFICENIKSIMRKCPNERPVEVFRNIEKTTDDSLHDSMQSHSFFEYDNGHALGSSLLDSIFGSFGFGASPGERFDPFQGVDSLFGIPGRGFDHSRPFLPAEEHNRGIEVQRDMWGDQFGHIVPPHKTPKGIPPVPALKGYTDGSSESI
mmetsp:Transcript_6168/g.9305  ORF Transcript_6168/g.9305 Transcript_6168/m.9305 type:complete len:183 (-) Transcript_6168:67-615(-)